MTWGRRASGSTPDTGRPRLTWSGVGAIDVRAALGEQATIRRTLQDGVQRTVGVALAWSFANGVAELGLDAGAEAASTSYYLYLVPSAASDLVLTLRASVNPPTLGPAGYAVWDFLGAFFNDAGSDIYRFVQLSAAGFSYVLPFVEVSNLVNDAAPVQLALASCPVTASAVELFAHAQLNGVGGVWFRVWPDTGAVPTDTDLAAALLAMDSSNGNDNGAAQMRGVVPLVVPASIYYRKALTGAIFTGRLFVCGWTDAYL